MIILGIDPGIARTGFGVIDTATSELFVRCGCITTPKEEATINRLFTVGRDLTHLIAEHRPEMAVVESLLFGNNVKTAMIVAETRGVINYVLRQHNIPVKSLTPLQIKSRLTGFGQASKSQIQQVVMSRLNLATLPEPDDAADAVAAALCLADEAYVR